jgi:hypothetical protein
MKWKIRERLPWQGRRTAPFAVRSRHLSAEDAIDEAEDEISGDSYRLAKFRKRSDKEEG